jgi:Plasmid pRiA4b ORF-3-like protein
VASEKHSVRAASAPAQALRYQRVARRTAVVTYRVRVDLRHTSQPAWRRLELASDLNLAELHDIRQVAFGWTDSHLHGFAAGPELRGDAAELYLCPFDEEEGEDEGVPEAQARLDEVLGHPGDMLSYAYGYGNDWQHLITLEAAASQ